MKQVELEICLSGSLPEENPHRVRYLWDCNKYIPTYRRWDDRR